MNRNSNSIWWMLVVLALSACGGGGGGGGGGGKDTDDNTPGPRLNINETTAEDVLILGFGFSESVLQLAQAAATGVYELTRPLVQTPLELECENNDGRRVLNYIDNDSSGFLSAGDMVEIRFDNCFDTAINDLVPNDVLLLTLTEFSFDTTGALLLKGELSLAGFTIQTPSGDSIRVEGDFEIQYGLSRLSETLTARKNDDEFLKIELLGSMVITFRDFSVTKNSTFPLTQYTFNSMATLQGGTIGFPIECRTPSAYTGRIFAGAANEPLSGSFSCLAQDNSSVQLTETRVLLDKDGNGSYEVDLGFSRPSDYVEGFAFDGPTHYPKAPVVDFTPTLDVGTSSLRSGGLAYDPVNELLYISEFSDTSIYNPNTGELRRHVIDTNGRAITLSPDGSLLYQLDGSIVRWFLPDGAFQGGVITDGFMDLAVSPASPAIFAISTSEDEGLVLYQEDTPFPNTLVGENVEPRTITFNDTGDRIYAYTEDGRVVEIAVVPDGVDVVGEVITVNGLVDAPFISQQQVSYEDGYIQFVNGWRIDVAAKRVAGQFSPTFDLSENYESVIIDGDANRAYALLNSHPQFGGVYYAFDPDTMTTLSRYQFTLSNGNHITSFGAPVDMGEHGLAVPIATTNGSFIHFIDKSLFADQQIGLCSSQNFDGLIGDQSLQQVYCEFKDILYNVANHKLYATTPGSLGQTGNSLLVIDPDTGNIEETLWLGSEPDKLALSGDNAILYVTLRKEASVLALDALTLDPFPLGGGEHRFWLGTNPDDLAVIPTALAVSPADPLAVSVAGEVDAVGAADNVFLGHYVNGARGSSDYSGFHSIFSSLHFSQDGSILYGLQQFATWIDIYSVDGTGVHFPSQSPTNFLSTAGVDVQGDRLLDRNGSLINLPAMAITDTLANTPVHGFDMVMIDPNEGHFYAYQGESNAADFIYRYDTATLQRTAKLEVSEFPRSSGAMLKLLNIGPQKIGVAWQKRLDIIDKADFVPCQENAAGVCE